MIDLEKEKEEFIKVYTEIYGEHDQIWQGWKKRAELAQQEISQLKAKLAKYESDDFVLVPRKPTEDMLNAFNEAFEIDYDDWSFDADLAYKGLIKAGEIK